jgi:hypothetical protein
VGHDARGWEGYVDARWRLRHRAVFNGGLGLCDCFQMEPVVVLWVVEVGLSFPNVGCFYTVFGLNLDGFGGGCVMCNFRWVEFT